LFYKNSQAAVVVYDVTKRDSFDSVSSWLGEIEENRDQDDMLVYLVGNRVDLGDEYRQVKASEATRFLREKNLDNFFETSAKTGLNVVELF
jgi:GTPase SAR1 family protein